LHNRYVKQKKKKKTRSPVSVPRLVIALIILAVTLLAFQVFKTGHVSVSSLRWKTFQHISGEYVGNGTFVTVKNGQTGGLLPPNYKQIKHDVSFTFQNPETGEKKSEVLFKNTLEFSSVIAFPDPQQALVYITKETNSECWWYTTWPEYMTLDDCKTHLYTYNLTTHDLTEVNVIDEKKENFITPFFLDSERKILWYAMDIVTKAATDTQDEQTETRLIKYDLSNNTYNYIPLQERIAYNYGGGEEKAKIVDSDKQGNLYILVSGGKFGTQLAKVDIKQNMVSFIPIDTKGIIDSLSTMQLAMDKQRDILYLVNNSWDGNTPSHFFVYSLRNNRFSYLGGIPTRESDDVRGFIFYKGSLLAGFSDGLGVYNPVTKKWKIVTEADGLLQKQVKDIFTTANNGLCLKHDDTTRMSCTEYAF